MHAANGAVNLSEAPPPDEMLESLCEGGVARLKQRNDATKRGAKLAQE